MLKPKGRIRTLRAQQHSKQGSSKNSISRNKCQIIKRFETIIYFLSLFGTSYYLFNFSLYKISIIIYITNVQNRIPLVCQIHFRYSYSCRTFRLFKMYSSLQVDHPTTHLFEYFEEQRRVERRRSNVIIIQHFKHKIVYMGLNKTRTSHNNRLSNFINLSA